MLFPSLHPHIVEQSSSCMRSQHCVRGSIARHQAEVTSVAEHKAFTQTKTHEINMENERIAKEKKAREEAIADIQERAGRM